MLGKSFMDYISLAYRMVASYGGMIRLHEMVFVLFKRCYILATFLGASISQVFSHECIYKDTVITKNEELMKEFLEVRYFSENKGTREHFIVGLLPFCFMFMVFLFGIC